jgi:copper resistance protein B
MRSLAGATALAMLLAGATGAPAAEPAGHSHALENPLVVMVMADELEWQSGPGEDGLAFDGYAWIGRDDARLWLRTEGSRTRAASDEVRTELLAWRPVGAWWNVVGGVRHDTGAGPARTYALVGLQGTAPYRAGVDADLVAGEGGQFGARVEAEYRLLVTNRLILTPRAEVEAWGRDDTATGIASGLAGVEAGLRLRYEFRREFAPYLGMEWRAALGDTADLARAAGEAVRDRRIVAGLRLWF